MVQNNPAVHQPDKPFAPFDFIFTKAYTQRARILDKAIRFAQLIVLTHENGKAWSEELPIIFTQTHLGVLEVRVSRNTYDLYEVGDHIVVEFQCGRWTGNLKGKIAK